MAKIELLLALAVIQICAFGCTPPGVSVAGSVKVNGQPIEEGEIQFVSVQLGGTRQSGAKIINGEYRLDNDVQLSSGDYEVRIRAFRMSGEKAWDGMGDGSHKNLVEGLIPLIPNKYNDSSVLKTTFTLGMNRYDVDLPIP